MSALVLPIVGTALSGLLVLAGVIYTQRVASKANRDTAALEQARIQLERIDSMHKEIDDLRRWRSEDRATHDREIRGLRERLEDLEEKRAGDRRAIHYLTSYVRTLLALLREYDIHPPVPPHGLDPEQGSS